MKLKEILDRKGISVAKFAETLEVTPSYVYYACSDKFNPTIKQAQKIADALGVSVSELLELDSDQNPTLECPYCHRRIKLVKDEG